MRRLLSSGNTSPLHHVCQLCAVALCWAHATPDVWPQTHPCLRSACVGRCVPHHTPIGIKAPDVSLSSQTSAPGTVRAPENRRFPAGSTGVQRTDHVASSWVQFPSGSRQRRHHTPQCGGQPPMRGRDWDSSGRSSSSHVVARHIWLRRGVSPRRCTVHRLPRGETHRCLLVPLDTTIDLRHTARNCAKCLAYQGL